jgi:beta-aspartyl-peptidase (threonine type)
MAALDAVCAAVVVLEDDEAFNAGRGAALTVAGTAELDACVCDGSTGLAGAVAASRYARNPVLAARAVMERTPHVLLAGPGTDWLTSVGLDAVDPSYFVTEARRTALREHPATGHGTVGAVARDAAGRLAAAADGSLVLAYCSQAMLRGYPGPDGPVVVT